MTTVVAFLVSSISPFPCQGAEEIPEESSPGEYAGQTGLGRSGVSRPRALDRQRAFRTIGWTGRGSHPGHEFDRLRGGRSHAEAGLVVPYTIDDPITDPLTSSVEVTIEIDGQKRWLFFTTPELLASVGDFVEGTQARFHLGERHMIVVSELSEIIIDKVLRSLHASEELLSRTLPLEVADDRIACGSASASARS
jgi:hypothetical protein